MESNDRPDIPDRGETSDIPGLPSGATAAAEGLAPFKLRTNMRICFNIFPNALMSLSGFLVQRSSRLLPIDGHSQPADYSAAIHVLLQHIADRNKEPSPVYSGRSLGTR